MLFCTDLLKKLQGFIKQACCWVKLAVINCGAISRKNCLNIGGSWSYGLQIPLNVNPIRLVSRVGDNTTMLDSQVKSLAALPRSSLVQLTFNL